MDTGDIATELSTSSIVEDDLNGVFNSLEPLEDPKDDMFFFGGKDLLQKIREKNPANTTANISVNVHRPNAPNKPMPPPSSAAPSSHSNGNSSGLSHIIVPTATCDPQPPLAPLAHPAKPYTSPSSSNDTKLSAAAIASATASVMYLDNYLAASNSQNKYPNTVTTAPPPLLPTVLDKPTKQPSVLRKPSHNRTAQRSVLSKSHPTYAPYNLLTTSNDPKLNDSNNPLKSSTGATDTSVSALHNPAAAILSTTPPPNIPPPGYAAGPVVHKRSRSSHPKNSSELKQGRVIYNPSMTNTARNSNSSNALHHSTEIPHPTALLNNNLSSSLSDNNPLTTSGSITRNVTPEVSDNGADKTNNYYTQNPNTPNTPKMENLNSHRVTANVDYMNYANLNHFFPYPGGMPVHNFYVPSTLNDAPVPVPEPNYRMEPHGGFDPANESSHPTPNPSNDLYSNLYLYSFNNMYNNNNNSHSRTTPPIPDMNSTYNNLYNYNNLYLNSLYGYPPYPARQYPPGYPTGPSAYETQAYRNGESFDEHYDNDEDYRTERHARGYSKRAKRRPNEDDEYRKTSRKSKSKSKSKRNKHSPDYDDTPRREAGEYSGTHTTTTDFPKAEKNLSPAVVTPPLSPAHNTKRTKANLFENTPKIKIGDVPSGSAKMSKLGRKLLEVVNLDWRTPFPPGERGVSTPILKSPTNVGTPTSSTTDEDRSWKENSQKTGEDAEVFAEYDNAPERKTELLYFVANNIEALLTMPTKIEVTLNDFKASALGTKVKQRLQVMTTIKQAKELGLIMQGQYEMKQKQYLDAFTFGMGTAEKKVPE